MRCRSGCIASNCEINVIIRNYGGILGDLNKKLNHTTSDIFTQGNCMNEIATQSPDFSYGVKERY